ncbi:hypothetical protein DOE64_05090 [Salmonella enterica subsp. enterica serovar Ohio]|nr:hypothetical protein DOE64_05090 [Salmonella enterica subsp. enterica serovar Ohio]
MGFLKQLMVIQKVFLKRTQYYIFPVNRYYNPAWLVDSDDPRIQTVENYVGQSNDNFIKQMLLKKSNHGY